MPSPKEKFLNEVTKYIKFEFDRYDIRQELRGHILDKTEYYLELGYDEETAEKMSVDDMGDAREIGIELNKQHNPILGWILVITNILIVLFAVWQIFFTGIPYIAYLFDNNTFYDLTDDIPKSDIVYKIDIDEEVQLDDTIIRFTNIIYEKNGDLHIFYEYYNTIGRDGWSLATIGEISDDLGNTDFGYSYEGNGGKINKRKRTLENFSKDARKLIINYDMYNRKYRVEIPLRAGDNNE